MQGLFSKTLLALSSQLLCHSLSHTHTNTHTHTLLLRKGQQMQMTQLTSATLPGNPPPTPSLALSLFEGSILIFSLLLRAQVTLPTAPFHVGTNWATNNQSRGPAQHGDLSVPTSAARPTVCLSAPLLGLSEQMPY